MNTKQFTFEVSRVHFSTAPNIGEKFDFNRESIIRTISKEFNYMPSPERSIQERAATNLPEVIGTVSTLPVGPHVDYRTEPFNQCVGVGSTMKGIAKRGDDITGFCNADCGAEFKAIDTPYGLALQIIQASSSTEGIPGW